MSVSSSGSDNVSTKNILSQVIASSPQGVPNQDKMSGNEVKQIQQTRQGKNTEMESNSTIAGTQGKEKAGEAQSIEQQGLAAGKEAETSTETTQISQTTGTSTTAVNTKTSEEVSKLQETSLSSLSSLSASSTQQIQELVAAATAGNSSVNSSLETPELPQPSVTPRQDVSEISLALAKAISALGEATASALSDYQSTQAQATIMSRIALESQGLKIDSERAEYKKLQEVQKQSATNKTMQTVNTVLMAVSITITVVSVVSALFTCGLGLIGTAAAGATAAATGAAAGATAGATVATSVATQVTVQAVMQAIKQAVVTAVKQAVMQAVKAIVKKSIANIIKTVVKTVVKTLAKNIGKIFNTGKSTLSRAFPNLSKVINALGSKITTFALGMAIAVPQLVQGIGSINLSNLQNELAEIQRTTGMLSAQAEMMNMFTQFWQQASKIAAKQVDSASEMQQQATKLGAQIAKAFTAISSSLASAA
ncbi:type III secretion system membrane protein [Chlamydia avium]|uniref:Secretion system effector C (SseC) like family protein n=1 Tax=Chlamydia avium 10DC88 TaxID=1229831 RepID=W8JRX3_9CHLA|nr:type III secretion system membrane protein [Chlamydia avium]AHK63588.1 Secretion system effector C (SseC) like family protein [Chlamydia avium 10DC88]